MPPASSAKLGWLVSFYCGRTPHTCCNAPYVGSSHQADPVAKKREIYAQATHSAQQPTRRYSCAGMFSFKGIGSFSLSCSISWELREARCWRWRISLLSSNALFLVSVEMPAVLRRLTSGGDGNKQNKGTLLRGLSWLFKDPLLGLTLCYCCYCSEGKLAKNVALNHHILLPL